MKKNVYRIFPWLLLLLGIALSLDNKMNLVLPMAVLVYIFRTRFMALLNRFSLPVAFIGSGLFFGLLTESFAIWSNLHLPYAERVLLSPYPHIDLILGFFWYGLFVLMWYFLLKKYHYKKIEIYALAGAYGILLEQKGVFLPMLFSPAFIVPLFIMFVYAVFPILAYMLTEHRFPARPQKTFLIRYLLAFALLGTHVLIWNFAGDIYYPILKNLGYLGHLVP